MANTTLTVAADTDVSLTMTEVVVGPGIGGIGSDIKAFTATAGTGTYPVAGLTLDLSALFPHKVLAVVCSPLYDPEVTTGDLCFPTVYVPATSNAPATGKLHIYSSNGAANAGLLIVPDATVTITGYVVTGFAIGY
jgi:hypothetical protein